MKPENYFERHAAPMWMRVGDALAVGLVALLFLGALLCYGYYEPGLFRSLAWCGCGVLGVWAGAGWVAGRWHRPDFRAGRLLLLLFAFLVVYTGLQLVPLPRETVLAVSPAWRESVEALEKARVDMPDRLPLAPTPEDAWITWNHLLASTLFLGACLMLASRRQGALWLIMIVIGFTFVEGMAGLARHTMMREPRAFAFVYNPNHHATSVLMGLPLAFVAIREYRRRRHRRLYGDHEDLFTLLQDPAMLLFGFLLLATMGWLTSYSRGSLVLGLPVVAGWLVVEFVLGRRHAILTAPAAEEGDASDEGWRGWLPGRAVLVPALLFGGCLVALLFFASAFEGFVGRFDYRGDDTGINRPEIWRATLVALGQSPWLGIGPGAAEYAINRNVRFPTTINAIETHNDYIQVVAELGIPATVVAIALGLFVLQGWNKDRQITAAHFPPRSRAFRRAAIAGILSALAHSAVDFPLRIPVVSFQFLALMAIALGSGPLFLLPVRRRTGTDPIALDDDDEDDQDDEGD